MEERSTERYRKECEAHLI